jgi:hypothetical protein
LIEAKRTVGNRDDRRGITAAEPTRQCDDPRGDDRAVCGELQDAKLSAIRLAGEIKHGADDGRASTSFWSGSTEN